MNPLENGFLSGFWKGKRLENDDLKFFSGLLGNELENNLVLL
jgi:hypothetical protein